MADNDLILEAIERENDMLQIYIYHTGRANRICNNYEKAINEKRLVIEALKEKQERESKPEIKHLFYKHRMQLSALYMQWLQEYNILDSSMSVLAFLEGNGLLNREKCLAFIEESEGMKNGE